VIERDAIEFWRDHAPPSDIAHDLFPAMLHRGALMHAYVSFEYIKDIGTPKRFDKAVSDLRGGVVRRARRDQPQALVFIDRDGTINELRGDLTKAQDFELMGGVAQAIYNLNDAEYRVVVATNQPVLARGKTSFAEMRRIHAKLATQLGKIGAFVDAIEMCPHHPDGGFPGEVVKLKMACNCRKPATLLVDRACDAFNADRSRSWFIGDTTSDMLCAAQAGLRSIVVATGEGGLDGKYAARPDYSAADLPSAVDYLLKGHARLRALVQPIIRALSPGQLVLIGGLAKQGKSSLSSVLREALRAEGVAAEILSLDGYLYDQEKREPGVSGRYDLDDARTALAPWLEGRVSLDLTAPHYDRRTRTRARETIGLKLPANGILIVEGVPALLLEPKTVRNVCRIFVGGDETARAARVVTDLYLRGSTSEDSSKLYQERQNDEFPIIVNTRESANVMLSLDRVFKS
jgi:histidinol-phosphate phosphatase family protein